MKLADLGQRLSARAVGIWRVEDAELVLTDFWAAPDLDPAIALAFTTATRRVAIGQADLGIVGATIDARPNVSIASDLPSASGSGLWLRRFGADRSIAVPRLVDGAVVEVASVAICDSFNEEAIQLLARLLND